MVFALWFFLIVPSIGPSVLRFVFYFAEITLAFFCEFAESVSWLVGKIKASVIEN
jgi:hypothetical protein